MPGIPLLYVAFVALPLYVVASFTDIKSKKIDTRPLYGLIGLLYGAFFANGMGIFYAVSVSVSLLLLQFVNNKAKLPPWGSGDFPLLQSFGLAVMLYSPALELFVAFMIVLLIFLGLYIWFFKDKSFAPSVAFTFFLFCFSKLVWI